MITLLVGPNSYAAREEIDSLKKGYDDHGIVQKTGGDIDVSQFPELFQGASLFAMKKLLILKDISENKAVWAELVDWLGKIPDETHLVLVEASPDKRTKTFKTLQKVAQVKVMDILNEHEAARWLVDYSKDGKTQISQPEVTYLVDEVGVDQWRLSHEFQKLAAINDTSKQRIDEVVEPEPQASAFVLVDAALQGKRAMISEQIKILETSEDPYKLFGLLASQVFQLAMLSMAKDVSVDQIAKDFKTHPYPLTKLKPLSVRLSKQQVKKIVASVAELDIQLKTSAGEPWLLLERALIKIAG